MNTDTYRATTALQYFTRSARAFPDNIAVRCADQTVTYRELDLESNAIAERLRRLGIQRGDLVPVHLPKSVAAIRAFLGVMKVGAAYVPLDVASPVERIAGIVRDCEAKVVIGASAELAALPEKLGGDFVCLAGDDTSTWDQAPDPTRYEPLSVDVAYVLFTSGSTGVPKGVMISHQAIVDYIDWCVGHYEISVEDNVANHAPLYFDNSTFDLYTAFKAGATLHLVPPELNAVLPRLVGWLNEHEISVFFCVPSVLTMLLKSRRLKPGMFQQLRHLIFAGEVVQPDVLDAWMRQYPDVTYTNMYGPTEITVDCSYYTVTTPPGTDAVPIGYARPNMALYVAEDHETESPRLTQQPGAQGELWVRGLSVGYGYLNNPERTAASFVQNPLHERFDDRLYRTGDLVKLGADGALYFLGRVDDQIKFLGHRIELGEIEAQLTALDEVEEGVVVFCAEASDPYIAALVASSKFTDESECVQSIQQRLKDRLPSYMQPTVIRLAQQEFPRTPNGKYDRKAVRMLIEGIAQAS